MNKQQKHREMYIDVLKVVAAFLVVFYHVAYYKLDYGFNEGTMYVPNLNRIVMCFCACSVPLFFMIHGILMLKKDREYGTIYKKAVKIAILYIVWSFFDFPGWFFRTLVILYIMFPVFQFLKNKQKVLYYVLCGMIFIMPFCYNFVVLIFKYMGNTHVLGIELSGLKTTGIFTLYSILYFLLGPLVAEKKRSICVGLVALMAGWGLVIFECVTYTNLNQKVYDGVNAAFPTIGALLLAIGVYIIVSNIKFEKLENVISLCGEAVLPVYLLHMAVIKLINQFIHIKRMNLFIALLISAVVYFICEILGKISKKIPIFNWFFRI